MPSLPALFQKLSKKLRKTLSGIIIFGDDRFDSTVL
jgi:hypothetical protein